MTVKKHAMDIAPGKSFVWKSDVYTVVPTDEKSDDEPLLYVFVIRNASLWPAETNPGLEHDTWIATNSTQVERFNPYTQVYPVTWKQTVEVTFERSKPDGQEGKAEEKKDEPKT